MDLFFKKKYILILTFLGINQVLFSQNSSLKMGIQSPTAASLGKFGEIPVSLYTGTPNIDIPLYKVNGRQLSLPIRLQYHASGNKVEEIPGWVGLGWALDAGGVITRSPAGLPDDNSHGYLYTGQELYDSDNYGSNGPKLIFLQDIGYGDIDSDPDYFFFNFAGQSGKFVLDHNGQAHVFPHKRFKITPQYGVNGEINEWEIITENGTVYKFSEVERTFQTSNIHFSNPSASFLYNSSWYLTQIRSPNGNNVIDLEYYAFPQADYRFRAVQQEMSYVCNCSQGTGTGGGSNPEYSEYSILEPKKLKSITTASEKITFHVSLRQDALSPEGEQQEHKLDSLIITSNTGKLKKKFLFNYNYLDDRLFLDSVVERDADDNNQPPYQFSYNHTPLPSIESYSIDYWGYYNGKGNSTTIPTVKDPVDGISYPGANREPDPQKTKARMLTRISYPTGGYTDFTYEAHDYGSISGDEELFGKSPLYDESVASHAQGEVTETFTIGGTRDVLVEFDITIMPDIGDSPPPKPWVELNGNILSYETEREYLELSPGTHEIKAVAYDDGDYAQIRPLWREIIPVKTKQAGGVRIKKIRTHNGINSQSDVVKKYNYKRVSEGKPDRSSGVLSVKPTYFHRYDGTWCTFKIRSAASFRPLASANGSPVGYKEVAVSKGQGGGYGKTVHRFRSADQVPSVQGSYLFPRVRYSNTNWKRGQEENKLIENQNSDPILKVTNDYEYDFLKQLRGISVYSYPQVSPCSGTQWGFYDYRANVGWRRKISETQSIFNSSNDSLIVTKDFNYVKNSSANSFTQLRSTTKTNSDGQVRKTIYEYAHEQYSGMAADQMLSQLYKVTTRDGSGNTLKINWTLWNLYNGSWQPCAQWTGGPELGTTDPPDC